MIITIYAKRYAKALFELAQEKNRIDETLDEFKFFLNLIEGDKDLKSFLNLPNDKEREKILSNLLSARVSELFFNFLLLVLKNKRFHLIHQIYDDFEGRVDSYNNRIKAVAITALPLTGNQLFVVNRAIAKYLNADVRLENKVDPSIIGGIVIRLNGKIFNASLAEQFNRLKHFLIKNQK